MDKNLFMLACKTFYGDLNLIIYLSTYVRILCLSMYGCVMIFVDVPCRFMLWCNLVSI
jgi:hypothetical protein